MATQTRAQRQTAARKAAATRKRNAARQSGRRAKSSARQTLSSARRTGTSARKTAGQTARSTAKRARAESTGLTALAEQARRGALIPIGAVLETRDRVRDAGRNWTRRPHVRQRLARFERRGGTAVRRNRRLFERQVKATRRSLENRAGDAQASAEQLAGRLRRG